MSLVAAIATYSSKTLTLICEHFTEETVKAIDEGKAPPIEFPFNLQAFCIANDKMVNKPNVLVEDTLMSWLLRASLQREPVTKVEIRQLLADIRALGLSSNPLNEELTSQQATDDRLV